MSTEDVDITETTEEQEGIDFSGITPTTTSSDIAPPVDSKMFYWQMAGGGVVLLAVIYCCYKCKLFGSISAALCSSSEESSESTSITQRPYTLYTADGSLHFETQREYDIAHSRYCAGRQHDEYIAGSTNDDGGGW